MGVSFTRSLPYRYSFLSVHVHGQKEFGWQGG